MASIENDLIVRPYTEIVDDVLVALVGGVVNEELIFDIRETAYPLAEPARDVRGITGEVIVPSPEGDRRDHRSFQPNVDWTFDRGQNAVVWLERGQKPADRSVFYADYFRAEVRESPLTDLNVGSVTRTLGEAISRELALLYRQVNLAYRSGFIDLAEGTALDFVVAILGIQRKRGDFAQGLESFFRTSTSRGNITIPQGTKLTATDGVVFETISERTLQRGQVRVDVPVRAAEAFRGPAGQVAAHTVNSTIFPIEGIDHIDNLDPMVLGGPDESDEDLRKRAKAALRGLGQCTVDALLLAAREGRAKNAEVLDPMVPPDEPGIDNSAKRTAPGRVVMIVEVEPARYDTVVGEVNGRRAAGVHVQFVARFVFIRPRMAIRLRRVLTPAGAEQLKRDVIRALTDLVAGLGSGKPVLGPSLLDAVKALDDVQDATIRDLLVWQTVMDGGPQLGQRRAARERIVGPAGAQATDAEIQAGQFQVTVDAQWWPVLEMEPADIGFVEAPLP